MKEYDDEDENIYHRQSEQYVLLIIAHRADLHSHCLSNIHMHSHTHIHIYTPRDHLLLLHMLMLMLIPSPFPHSNDSAGEELSNLLLNELNLPSLDAFI